jgi:hypothetical protein
LVLLELLEVPQVVMVEMAGIQLLVHWQLLMVAEVEQEFLLVLLLETQVVAAVVLLLVVGRLALVVAVLADQITRLLVTEAQMVRKVVLLQFLKFHRVALEF